MHAAGDLFAHARQLGDETVIVVFNTARSHRRLDLALQGLIPDGTILENVWTHEGLRVEHGALHQLELTPRSSLILSTLQGS